MESQKKEYISDIMIEILERKTQLEEVNNIQFDEMEVEYLKATQHQSIGRKNNYRELLRLKDFEERNWTITTFSDILNEIKSLKKYKSSVA